VKKKLFESLFLMLLSVFVFNADVHSAKIVNLDETKITEQSSVAFRTGLQLIVEKE